MLPYHHYIWDFDGTLFDSYPHSTRALYLTARHYGVEVRYDDVSRAIRHSFARAFALVGLTEEQLRMFHRQRGDDAFEPPIVPFPHAEAVLRALKDAGVNHYLYTHSNHKMSVRFLKNFGLDRYFTGWVTPDDPGFTMKPDPGAIRYILDHWRIAPADAVMVGDREIDVRCARDAGVDGILVDPDRLVDATCARYRVDDLMEIPGLTL
jgi:HAD superfamily hydrolase (TIGR01549 family)